MPHAIVGGQETRWGFSVWKQNLGLGLNREQIPQPGPSAERPRDFDVGGRGLGWPRAWWSVKERWGEKVGRLVPPAPQAAREDA